MWSLCSRRWPSGLTEANMRKVQVSPVRPGGLTVPGGRNYRRPTLVTLSGCVGSVRNSGKTL